MRFPEPELYRRLLAYIHHRIRLSREEPTSSAGYAGPENLIDDLQVIRKSLVAHNAIPSAELLLDPLLRTIRVFGFHLHSIDIRQHARVQAAAVAEIACNSATRSEPLSANTADVLDTLRVVKEIKLRYGCETISAW